MTMTLTPPGGPDAMMRRMGRRTAPTTDDVRCSPGVLGVLEGRGRISPVAPGSLDMTAMPVLTWPRTVHRPEEALRLQMSYLAIHERFKRYGRRSRRRDLLDAPHHTVGGVRYVTLAGLVVEAVGGDGPQDGRPSIERICLLAPGVVDHDMAGRPVDGHIWLSSRMLRTNGDTPRLTVHLGEVLTVDAELRTYTDATGMHRVGVGLWRPLAARMAYGRRDADGRVEFRWAPPEPVTAFRVFSVGPRFRRWRDLDDLNREIDRAKADHPKWGDGLALVDGDAS